MTTEKWIKKQLNIAIDIIDDIEELKSHLQMILTRLELSPLEHIEQLRINEKHSEKYYELIGAISDKCSGETRHERALRYIKCYHEVVNKAKGKSISVTNATMF